jgi:hypothetical protein
MVGVYVKGHEGLPRVVLDDAYRCGISQYTGPVRTSCDQMPYLPVAECPDPVRTNVQLSESEHPMRDRPQVQQSLCIGSQKGGLSGSNDLLGDLVAKARQGARGETGALESP